MLFCNHYDPWQMVSYGEYLLQKSPPISRNWWLHSVCSMLCSVFTDVAGGPDVQQHDMADINVHQDHHAWHFP